MHERYGFGITRAQLVMYKSRLGLIGGGCVGNCGKDAHRRSVKCCHAISFTMHRMWPFLCFQMPFQFRNSFFWFGEIPVSWFQSVDQPSAGDDALLKNQETQAIITRLTTHGEAAMQQGKKPCVSVPPSETPSNCHPL